MKAIFLIGDWDGLRYRTKSSAKCSGDGKTTINHPEDRTLTKTTLIDREALWLDLQHDPELQDTTSDSPAMSRSESEETEGEDEEERDDDDDDNDESEHTESGDTGVAQNSTENSSSGSTPYSQQSDDVKGCVVNGFQRVDSQRTQASDSLSSEDEDGQLEALAKSHLLKRQREKQEAVDSLFQHVLLYRQPYQCTQILYAFSVVETLLQSSPGPFIEALGNTTLDYSSTAHLNLIQNLLQRHRQAQEGATFYGPLQIVTPPSPRNPNLQPSSPLSSTSSTPTSLLEILTCLCLRFLRSYFPSYAKVNAWQLQENREVQVKSVEVLTALLAQLVTVAQQAQARDVGTNGSLEAIHNLLHGSKLQEYVLLMLSVSMYICQRAEAPDPCLFIKEEGAVEKEGISEESLVHCGRDGSWAEHSLQIALLKLLKVLIVLEHCVSSSPTKMSTQGDTQQSKEETASSALTREWQTSVMFQQSIKAIRYVTNQPITAQGMFVSAAARALCPQYGFAMHPAWVTLLCQVLPYLGRSLAIIVTPIITQICRNLDELVKQHEHDGVKTTHR